MDRLTKIALVLWVGAMLSLLVLLNGAGRGWLSGGMALLFAVAVLASCYYPPVVAVVLVAGYWTPVIARGLWGGIPYTPHEVVWLLPLFGVILPDLMRSPWRIPRGWRIPLLFASYAVAVVTPIVILREAGFIPGLLLHRPEWHWQGGTWPLLMANWIGYSGVSMVLGLLWFDWLFGQPPERFFRHVVTPLLVSAGGLVVVGLYQFFVDVSFLNDTVYGVLRRAGGTLYDSNLAGMVIVMWLGGFLAWTGQRRSLPGAVVASVAVLMWMSIWATGSRTAFVAGLVVTLCALPGRIQRWWRPTRVTPVAVFIAVVVLNFVTAGNETVGPVARFRALLTHRSGGSVHGIVSELWNRNRYGFVATELIKVYPWFGIGVGAFHTLAPEISGLPYLPPDNAQNWVRHQVVELGLLGSVGYVAWFLSFAWFVVRPRNRAPASAWPLRGVLLAFGGVSMFGVPGQDALVALTFWTFAYWFSTAVGAPVERESTGSLWWTVISLATVTVALGTAHSARTSLSPQARALAANTDYGYGLGPATVEGEFAGYRVGSERAVSVLRCEGAWLSVTVRLRDTPPAPVAVRVQVNGESVLKGQLRTTEPLTGSVAVSGAPRALLEVDARPADEPIRVAFGAPREPYLITWEFHQRRP